jgi:hypothetical protein
VKQRRPLEIVVGTGSTLNPLHEFGYVFDVGCGHRAAGVVDQDVDATVGFGDLRDHGVDGAQIALVADHLGGAPQPFLVLVRAGKAVELRPGAADDGGARAQQFVRDADADSAAGACDDGDLSAQDTSAIHPPNVRPRPIL